MKLKIDEDSNNPDIVGAEIRIGFPSLKVFLALLKFEALTWFLMKRNSRLCGFVRNKRMA